MVRTNDTAGLKCAPLSGPRRAIRTASTATVAPVFASSATALSFVRCSAAMPEPMTAAASAVLPNPSASRRRDSGSFAISTRHTADLPHALLHLEAVERCNRQLDEWFDPVLQR